MRSVLLAAASTLVMATALRAADLPVDSKVSAVTAFTNGALVTRSGTVTMEPGEHTLVFSNLPIGLDPESLRVEGAAEFALEIGSVDVRRVDPRPVEPERQTEAERRREALKRESALLEDRIAAAEARRAMADRFANAGMDGIVKGIGEGKAGPSTLKETWAVYAEAYEQTLKEVREAHQRQKEIEEELARIAKSLERDPTQLRPVTEARIAVAAQGAGEAELRVTYRMAGAGWQPVYDARLTSGTATEKPSVVLVTRAAVRQSTGEDWTDVALTLSTARPSRGTAAEALRSVIVTTGYPLPPSPIPAPAPRAESRRNAADSALLEQAPAAPPAVAKAMIAPVEREAEAETNGSTVVYRVPGRVSVQQGPGGRNLKVTEQRADALLSVKAVPKILPAAYLTAAFKARGDSPVLPGRASVYRDGVFMGTTALAFTQPGEEMKIGFGEDERVKIERSPVKQTEGETGTFSSTRVEVRDYRIRVKSGHDRVLPVTIEDQLPVSEATEVTIERLSTTTPPTKTNVDDRRGVLAWSFDLKPGEEREIRFGWTMRSPADKPVRYLTPDR